MSHRSIVFLLGALLLPLLLLARLRSAAAEQPLLAINEILPGNASTNLDSDRTNYSAWIELYNGGETAVDLKDYALAYVDYGDEEPVVWTVPDSLLIPAKGTILFWADERDNKGVHTNFELDMRGSEIRLLDPAGGELDHATYDMRSGKTLLPDVSYGRLPDGGANWAFFDQPTPGAANTTTGLTEPDLAEAAEFTPEGGFYSGSQMVTLSTSEAGGAIRYTTDGSIPGPSSNLYSGAIPLTGPTVIRARVYVSGKLASLTASHTYLIDVDANLPVVSLATWPAHLFDDEIGIYVEGTNGAPGNCSAVPVNWNQPWERPASLEFFETDGQRVVAQDVGIEIFGGCTRTNARKSLEIKARRTYGDNDIDYQILPDKPIDSYKRLVLRNAGNDARQTLFRDALQQYLVRETMDVDYQTYRPVVLFLNGAYWGIHNLREKADEAFVEQNYDLDADSDFDMLRGLEKVEAGDREAWEELYAFVLSHDLRVAANFDHVESQVDLDEFINYNISEIYINNTDWPVSNTRYWRAYDNGRWRWVLYDLDLGFDKNEVGTDWLTYVLTCSDCPHEVLYETALLRRLMENDSFREKFVQRFASHIQITYDPARVSGLIDTFKAGIEPEMPAHIARWGNPVSMGSWEARIDDLRQFAEQRPAAMMGQLDAYLGAPGSAELVVNVEGEGDVFVAGVQAPGSGYSGSYFVGIPMALRAEAHEGWIFDRWQETGTRQAETWLKLAGKTSRTAVFHEATDFAFLPLAGAAD
ncbi:MAG: CotH kinase family protein [Candidatus Promineifilaceae bacterium]